MIGGKGAVERSGTPLGRRAAVLAIIGPGLFAGAAHAHSVEEASLYAGAEPWVILALFTAGVLYAAGLRRLWRQAGKGAGMPYWRVGCFFSGLALLAIALLPPLDTLGGQLFSMHMLQHEVLMLGAAPLIVTGMPLAIFLWAFPAAARKRIAVLPKNRLVQQAWQWITRPMTAWTLHAAVLWLWHVPRFFQAGLLDDDVHAWQHFSFLAVSLLFWSAVIGRQNALRHGVAVLYLLTTLIHTGMLGALLTFSPRPWYPAYDGRTQAWGLSLLEDQQLGGLIMWVPAGFLLLAIGLVFAAKLLHPDSAGRQA